MTWKSIVCVLAGITGVVSIELLAMHHGLNGTYLALSLCSIAFLAALPIEPKKVIAMFKKIVEKIIMKLIPIGFIFMIGSCDKVNLDVNSAIDCVKCIIECADVVTASAKLEACAQEPTSDLCREIVNTK